MVRVFGFIAGVLILFGAVSPAGAEKPLPAPKPKELRIGLLKPMFKDVSQGLINAAAKPFEGMIQSKTGLKGSLTMAPDYKELANDIKDGKIDLAVFHGYEYAWVKDTPGLAPLVVALPNCGTVQACLIVNDKSAAKTPACLKGKSVLVPKGTKAHCTMYLDRIRSPLPKGDCCPVERVELSIEQALSELANGRADAVVVDISSLNALESNFPACFRALRVLDRSSVLPSAVVVYREGAFDANTVKKLKDGLLNSAKSAEGVAFTVFWQLKGFGEITPQYNDLVKACLSKYPAPTDDMDPMSHIPVSK